MKPTINAVPQTLSGCEVLPAMEHSGPIEKPTEVGFEKSKGKTSKRESAGRFEVLNNFVDFTLRNLDRSELAVWMILFRDARDGVARTSQQDIARRGGMTARTVRRVLKKLERRRLLLVVHQGGLNRGISGYRVVALEPIHSGQSCVRCTADKSLHSLRT